MPLALSRSEESLHSAGSGMENITLTAQILTLRSSVDSALIAGREDKQPPSPQARWAPGEQMTARVEAALPGGRFHVRVDDLLLEVNLPEGFKTGDRIELQFVSAQPRPSFILNSQPEPARQDVELSRAGKALGDILKSVASEKATTPATVKAPAPLLPAPTTEAPKLAQALSGSLARSGVFYESHQSQWVLGQRSVQDLLSEPQGKLSPVLHAPGEAGTPPPLSLPADKAVTGDGANAASSNAHTPDVPPVHQDALPQVRSQLQALESQQLVWQGQLWPGQEMEWSIQDPGDEPSHTGEALPWFTQLRLRFPQLGSVSADLALVDRALRIRLNATDAQTQARMNEAHAALANALSAAGIELISFKVTGDGD
jgi:hypothetical protein